MFFIIEYDEKYNKLINEFIISIYVEEFGFEEHREEISNQNNSIYINDGGNLWIALNEDNEIIGTIAAVKHSEDDIELKKMYVRKDYRGEGVSKSLYQKMLNWCKENYFKRIFLGTYNKLETAIHFYLKKGFTEIKNKVEEGEARFFELYL